MSPILKKDGQIMKRGGAIVKTSSAADCPCCGDTSECCSNDSLCCFSTSSSVEVSWELTLAYDPNNDPPPGCPTPPCENAVFLSNKIVCDFIGNDAEAWGLPSCSWHGISEHSISHCAPDGQIYTVFPRISIYHGGCGWIIFLGSVTYDAYGVPHNYPYATNIFQYRQPTSFGSLGDPFTIAPSCCGFVLVDLPYGYPHTCGALNTAAFLTSCHQPNTNDMRLSLDVSVMSNNCCKCSSDPNSNCVKYANGTPTPQCPEGVYSNLCGAEHDDNCPP